MPLTKNQTIPLHITALSHEGDGIGRFEGMAVFVPMTVIGDVIEAKIVKALASRAYAITNRMLSPSLHRIPVDCPVFRRCGGCSLRHMDYSHEMEIKSAWVAENLKRIGGVETALDPALPSPERDRYRNKAQYPVRRVNGKIRAGFFVKRSHDLIPVEDCLLQPAFFKDIVNAVLRFMEDFGIEPYDEFTGKGVVRHLFIRSAASTGEAMLCLVVNEALPDTDALIRCAGEACPYIKTVVINENRKNTNVIFGEKTGVIHGSGFITDELCGVRVNISAQSFYQVNRPAAEQLYRAALAYAAPRKDDVLLDLYCGTGTIGLSMAHAVKEVVGVEIIPQAVADAGQNAEQNGVKNARFFCADASGAETVLEKEGIRPDIVVLDPPRKGVSEDVLAFATKLLPRKIVYISCNSATLARDVKILAQSGYRLEKARAVDLFPRTNHVEAIALLQRQDHAGE